MTHLATKNLAGLEDDDKLEMVKAIAMTNRIRVNANLDYCHSL